MTEKSKLTARDQKQISRESLADQMKQAIENGTLEAAQDPKVARKPLPKREYPYGVCPNPENK